MEGAAFPEGHIEILGRLTERQRVLIRTLGALDERYALLGRVETWLALAEVVLGEKTDAALDDATVQELLLDPETDESLQNFVLRDLSFSSYEVEQIEALLPLARTELYLSAGWVPAAPRTEEEPEPARPAPPRPAAQRRYTEITLWADEDIWTAQDTRRGRHVFLRSTAKPGQTAPWSEKPPRFQSLGRYGKAHWRGFDMATGRWMYLAHPSGETPNESLPGWTVEEPAAPDGAPAEEAGAPVLDEAVQGLVDAVRYEDVQIGHFAAPLHHVDTWRRLVSLGPLAEWARTVDQELRRSSDVATRNAACQAVAGLHAEMDRLASRFEVMDGWPAGWARDKENDPEKYARMLRLGCGQLRSAVRRIARVPANGDTRSAATQRTAGRKENEVQQALNGLTYFAWSMGQERCPSEWFADPLHRAGRLSALQALHSGCPDLAQMMQYLDQSVRAFREGRTQGFAYEHALQEAQRLLRSYSERLLELKDRWPSWEGGRDELPEESPTAYAAMMRLGWQMLDAERQELRTFVNWEHGPRDPNMPPPKTPGSTRVSKVRASIPKRAKPLAPLELPDVETLRAVAQDIATRAWPAEAFAHPLSWVKAWRDSPQLRAGYPELSRRAEAVARTYDTRASYGETYKNAVSGLIEVLEAVRVALRLLGPGWPENWAIEDRSVPEEAPALLLQMIEDGKRELRRSTRDLKLDLREAGAKNKNVRSAPSSGRGAGTRQRGRRRATPPKRGGTRRRQVSTSESIRRFFFGSRG